MARPYVIDPAALPTRVIPVATGGEVLSELYLDGADGGPEASRGRFSEGLLSPPHFHLGAQFQLLLAGQIRFGDDLVLEGPAVHYTDHHVAYGPFTTAGPHEMLVLHARPAGLMLLDDPANLKLIDKSGRELIASALEVEWEPVPGSPGVRRKVLIDGRPLPSVVMLECPPGTLFRGGGTRFGRFDVVYQGSVEVAGQRLGKSGLRFLGADEEETPLRCGAEGAILIVLEFDANAAQSFGGTLLETIEDTERRGTGGSGG